MIVVTGAAGFIGSATVSFLNQQGIDNILAVDVLRSNDKWINLRHLRFYDYLDRAELLTYLRDFQGKVEAVIHMGACSATTEKDAHYLMENNYRYTLQLARWALENKVRFIYASSAATYGDGQKGYVDDHQRLTELKPLNMYGYSKHLFDLKALREGWLDKMVGLKFFNVYGPNEYFKGDMASVIFKAFNQINASGELRLFKSHRPDFKDGEQLRDFIYVKDVVAVIDHFLNNPQLNGIFNVGTGKARSFKDLAIATFKAMKKTVNIEYIPMPEAIRAKYQYFTQASVDKLRAAGYDKPFYELEQGIEDYVINYLAKDLAPF